MTKDNWHGPALSIESESACPCDPWWEGSSPVVCCYFQRVDAVLHIQSRAMENGAAQMLTRGVVMMVWAGRRAAARRRSSAGWSGARRSVDIAHDASNLLDLVLHRAKSFGRFKLARK
jgi:hypothetical protein